MPHKRDSKMPGSVTATINYHTPEQYPDGKKIVYLGTAGDKYRKHDERSMIITDMRSCDEDFNLDKNGFQWVHGETSLKREGFSDLDFVKEHYYPEVEDILKRITGASAVRCMSHIVRDSTSEEVEAIAKRVIQEQGEMTMIEKMHPARTAHCDQSFLGAEQAMHFQYTQEEADKLMKTRWAIINVWRPLKPVHRDPLAVCDWRTVSVADDLVAVDLAIPSREKQKGYGAPHGEAAGDHTVNRWDVKYSPDHRWYYASRMGPDECLLLKIFDSKKDGRARCCPHTSFHLESDEGTARESVEFRTLVFWEDEPAE